MNRYLMIINSEKITQNNEKLKFPHIRYEAIGSGTAFQSIGQYRY